MKTKVNGGEPAFPSFNEGYPEVFGISIREHFAAMAMQGIASTGSTGDYEAIAYLSVSMADALIDELNKGAE